MGDDEDRGREDLIQAILRVLPIDPEDGTTVVGFTDLNEYDNSFAIWGAPRGLARRILDALDSAYTDRDMQAEHNYNRHAEDEELF